MERELVDELVKLVEAWQEQYQDARANFAQWTKGDEDVDPSEELATAEAYMFCARALLKVLEEKTK